MGMHMKAKIIFLLILLLGLSVLVSCNLPGRITPTDFPIIKNTTTAGARITETPSPTVTTTFIPGDLGSGTVHGKITDANTGAPIVGAKVTCWHTSYVPHTLCNVSILTGNDGEFIFSDIYFHDTDHMQVKVEAPGYVTQTIDAKFFTMPTLLVDFALVPDISTEPPQVMCSQPACRPYEALACPQGNCINGCGYICITPAAICTPPACAIGTSEVYYCEGVCPGGCGTTCATFTPAP
jgi:hypothetical protein